MTPVRRQLPGADLVSCESLPVCLALISDCLKLEECRFISLCVCVCISLSVCVCGVCVCAQSCPA